MDITVRSDVENPLAEIKDRIAKFEYELKLANHCKEARLTKVVTAFEDDQILIPGHSNAVFFLVFELADGDLREQSDLDRCFDLAFRLRVLHRTAGGVRQLHWAQIAHQDLKHSNIVVFDC